jgi:xanthine/uracil permease
VLYGMIGLIGAKIWVDNKVDFGNPVNIAPLAAGLIMGIGNVTLHITKNFELGGIALGTIATIAFYHMVQWKKSDLVDADVTYTSEPDSYLSTEERPEPARE